MPSAAVCDAEAACGGFRSPSAPGRQQDTLSNLTRHAAPAPRTSTAPPPQGTAEAPAPLCFARRPSPHQQRQEDRRPATTKNHRRRPDGCIAPALLRLLLRRREKLPPAVRACDEDRGAASRRAAGEQRRRGGCRGARAEQGRRRTGAAGSKEGFSAHRSPADCSLHLSSRTRTRGGSARRSAPATRAPSSPRPSRSRSSPRRGRPSASASRWSSLENGRRVVSRRQRNAAVVMSVSRHPHMRSPEERGVGGTFSAHRAPAPGTPL